jgi:hypothetical protein
VIEVKSSANTNVRIDRQVEAISGLHQYLESDQSDKLFGLQNLKRMELGVPELNYQAAISQQIAQAREKGFCHQSPEKGLHIFALSSAKMDELGKAMSRLEQPIMFFLNETKRDQTWGSYYPFVLSIDQPAELYAFLKGEVYLLVVIEFGVCEALAREKGWQLNYRESGDYAFEFMEANGEEEEPVRFNLSRHFLGRIAHEFLSLQWVMDLQEHNE